MSKQSPVSPELEEILRILGHARVTVFAQDAELRYRWIENPPQSWQTSDIAGKTEIDLLPAGAAALATSIKREVVESGRGQWTDLIVETGGGADYFDLYVEPDRDAGGATVGILGMAVAVTDRRKQAATMDAVARDLSHRTKNLLAVIQSLGTQTARSTSSTEEFIEEFRGRIQSISRSQDLSIGAGRHSARLSSLIETQVHPYVADVARQVAFAGADCHLTANGALHVGLAFYELCIGSVRFGALSQPDGRVSVSAAIVDGPDSAGGRRLDVTWQEKGGAPVGELEGFSKILLERIVPASVGGRASIGVTDGGRRYTLSISSAEFD